MTRNDCRVFVLTVILLNLSKWNLKVKIGNRQRTSNLNLIRHPKIVSKIVEKQ